MESFLVELKEYTQPVRPKSRIPPPKVHNDPFRSEFGRHTVWVGPPSLHEEKEGRGLGR